MKIIELEVSDEFAEWFSKLCPSNRLFREWAGDVFEEFGIIKLR